MRRKEGTGNGQEKQRGSFPEDTQMQWGEHAVHPTGNTLDEKGWNRSGLMGNPTERDRQQRCGRKEEEEEEDAVRLKP